jgi:hypothetical protein
MNKRLFLPETANFFGADREALGRAAAADEQQRTYVMLAAQASETPPTDNPVGAAVIAIEQMRAAGHEPQVVLVPDDFQLRPMLGADPDFEWSRRHFREELGHLAGVPVLDVGPPSSTYLVVADLSKSARVRELRRPGTQLPLLVDVKPIEQARAEEMLDRGLVALAPGQTHDEGVRVLVDERVEVRVGLDVRFSSRPSDGAGAAFRVRLRP